MLLHFLFQLTNVSNRSLGGNDFARSCQESDELWNIHRILYRNFWPCSKLCKYNKDRQSSELTDVTACLQMMFW